MIWGNDSANDSTDILVSIHNLKQTAKWGHQMYQQGENNFLMKAERYLWKLFSEASWEISFKIIARGSNVRILGNHISENI